MEIINQKIKTQLELIEARLNNLDYDRVNSCRSCNQLKSELEKAIELIPGCFENAKIVQSLNYCSRDIDACQNNFSETDFKYIKGFLIEVLKTVQYYPV